MGATPWKFESSRPHQIIQESVSLLEKKILVDTQNQTLRGPGIIVTGPTGSSKSLFAAHLAQACGGIIINADPAQVYKQLPILTAQPVKGTGLKLYGFLDVSESFDVAQWLVLAKREILKAWRQKKIPLIVGGSGFYLHALRKGLSPLPSIPPALRLRLRDVPSEELHRKLRACDPIMAAAVHEKDTYRLRRALEVFYSTKKSLAYFQQKKVPLFSGEWIVFKTVAPREWLHMHCQRRTEGMFQSAKKEIAHALKAGLKPNIANSIGVLEALALYKGHLSLEDAIKQTVLRTKQYRKRQETWSKKYFPSYIPVNAKAFVKFLSIAPYVCVQKALVAL